MPRMASFLHAETRRLSRSWQLLAQVSDASDAEDLSDSMVLTTEEADDSVPAEENEASCDPSQRNWRATIGARSAFIGVFALFAAAVGLSSFVLHYSPPHGMQSRTIGKSRYDTMAAPVEKVELHRNTKEKVESHRNTKESSGGSAEKIDVKTSWVPKQLSEGKFPGREFRHHIFVNHNKAFFPVFSTIPLYTVNKKITNVVIWIHGLPGNANKYFFDGLELAHKEGAEKTVTLAPWFGTEQVTGEDWNEEYLSGLPHKMRSVYWDSADNWLAGGASAKDTPGGPVTSFGLLSDLVKKMKDVNKFPNIKKITIAGFSAGCQMASRWVFFNELHDGVQVVAAHCSSYLYLDDTRPAAECRSLHDTGAKHKCGKYEKPSGVPGFDDYKYGLKNLANTFDKNFSKKEIHDLIKKFPKKKVQFLFGSEDVCNCRLKNYDNPSSCYHPKLKCNPVHHHNSTCCDTFPDTQNANACDSSPAANLQGSNRLQRGLNYVTYLRHFYRMYGGLEYFTDDFKWPTYGVLPVGHDSKAFRYSHEFLRSAFK